jgi:chromosome segregation ATPase
MRSPFLTALLHPLNMIMLGLALFAGLFSAWWLFPIGLLFWLIMVLRVARDPTLRFNHQMQERAPLAQRFQRYFDRIERAQLGVFNTLSSAPNATRRVLQPVQTELELLTDQVYALGKRMTTLENYRMVTQSQSDLEHDLQELNETIEQTEDDLVRREYEESRQSLQNRLDKLKAVSTQLERVEAQLMSLSNELDATVTEVIRLQAMGADSAKQFVPELTERLRQQRLQLREFESEAVQV